MNDASERYSLCEEGGCQGFGSCDARVRRVDPAPQPEETNLLATTKVSIHETEGFARSRTSLPLLEATLSQKA